MGDEAKAVVLDENGFIPGTQYKSVDELVKGHSELKGKLDTQGNELGTIRKEHESLKTQSQTLAQVLKETLTKDSGAAPEKMVDYEAEIAAVDKQIQELDPIDKDYQKNLASLVKKSNSLTAASQHEKTLSAAGEMMKKELGDRDVKLAQETFYRENPTFNTPEMQARIREYIAKDRTGMSDPLSAFREIQRDDTLAENERIKIENAEYKRLIDLNKGKDESGKVVTKPQGAGLTDAKPPKVTGQALDDGMRAALQGVT